jgi:hypothetical protein
MRFSEDDLRWMHDAVDVMVQGDYRPAGDGARYAAVMARLAAGDGPLPGDLADIIEALHVVLREGGLDEVHCAGERPAGEELLSRLARIWHPVTSYGAAYVWSGRVQRTDGQTAEAEMCEHAHGTEGEAEMCAALLAERLNTEG